GRRSHDAPASDAQRIAGEDKMLGEAAAVQAIGAPLVQTLEPIDTDTPRQAHGDIMLAACEREPGIREDHARRPLDRILVAAAKKVAKRNAVHATTETHR